MPTLQNPREYPNLFGHDVTIQAKSEHTVFHICKRHIRHCGDTVKDKARGDNLAGFVVCFNQYELFQTFHRYSSPPVRTFRSIFERLLLLNPPLFALPTCNTKS